MGLRLLLHILLIISAFVAAGPLSAAEPLVDRLCVLQTATDVDFDAAMARSDRCRDGDFSIAGPRVWAFAPVADLADIGEPLLLSVDPSSFERMLVHVRDAEGHWTGRSYDNRIAAENWRAGMRFTVGLATDGADVTALAVAFDRPRLPSNISNLALTGPLAAETNHVRTSLFYAFFIALLIVPMIYNLAFFSVLREQFMLWHIGMGCGIIGYAIFSGGFVYYLVPDIALPTRWTLNMWSIAVGVTASAMFCRTFLEPGKVSPLILRAIDASAILILVTTATVTLGGPPLRVIGQKIYLLSFAPATTLFAIAIIQALFRDSRAARFQAVAWSALILCAFDRIGRGIGLYEGPAILDFAIYIALAFETVVTALGIADRVMTIRRQRDSARESEAAFEKLASTDYLTGLNNRRALVAAFDDATGSFGARGFALVDLDHFKRVNDRHGHDVGDRVLQSIAQVMREWSNVTAGRIGGEEFVALIHSADPRETAKRLCAAISDHVRDAVPELQDPLTASIGLVPILPGQSFTEAYRAADKCLYRAKEAGRNQVVADWNAPVVGEPERAVA
ncbi:diguanylate cyclase [Parasphingopyxis algicola]|uniref:sensor domain-containing diguanylate cyclase n=1 Tax=Parasphingopyxis algicola TaxID=2026624 RepID=UPI0015A361BF|nr:diguanylate cyclase [Parasphingopyxis algicola]QLC25566.1 diguanylate cyclase [Parasphingopyxis algicola]